MPRRQPPPAQFAQLGGAHLRRFPVRDSIVDDPSILEQARWSIAEMRLSLVEGCALVAEGRDKLRALDARKRLTGQFGPVLGMADAAMKRCAQSSRRARRPVGDAFSAPQPERRDDGRPGRTR